MHCKICNSEMRHCFSATIDSIQYDTGAETRLEVAERADAISMTTMLCGFCAGVGPRDLCVRFDLKHENGKVIRSAGLTRARIVS